MPNLGISYLKEKVRPVTDADKYLPRFSYSKLEKFKNCPYQYYLQYEKGNYPPSDSLALQLGSTIHKALEMKARALMVGEPVDYDFLGSIITDGYVEQDEKTREILLGTKDLSKIYFEDWYGKNEKSGLSYVDKMRTFEQGLYSEMEDDGYHPVFAERKFEYVWDNRIRIFGFIDSIRKNDEGQVKICDYKSSNSVYDDSKLKTSLQFFVYQCALLSEFGTLADECEYDFVLLGEKQKALSPGWEKRGIKAVDKILDSIDEMKEKNQWNAKGSPLCYWCPFCQTNPNTEEPYKNMCDYYSLWTPTEKSFAVNNRQDFDPKKDKATDFKNRSNWLTDKPNWETNKQTQEANKPTTRKLIF